MEHRQLIIENDDIKQLDYLTRLLATDARIIYVVEIGANYTIIDVDLPASYIATFNKFVAKAIVVTEKFNYLSELIDMVNMDYVRATFFSTLLYFDIHTYTPTLEVPFQVPCAFYYMLIIRDKIMHSERLNWLGYI